MEGYQEKPVWLTLLLIGLGCVMGLAIGSTVGLGIASLIYTGDSNITEGILNMEEEAMRVPLLVIQGMTTLVGFLIVPYFVWKSIRKRRLSFFNPKPVYLISFLSVFSIVILFIITDSVIIEWNQSIHFPDFLKGFEKWARDKEDQLEKITKMLTNFASFGEFVIAFVVVAILAAVCEEFLFRGIVQTELFRGTKNIHVAIWASAFLFSAIHTQFFGLIPRMLLGALFGYLYYWSGNLWIPMFGHFINNAFTIVMIYLFHLKIIDTDLDSSTSAPWPAVIISTVVSVLLLLSFRNKFHSSKPIIV